MAEEYPDIPLEHMPTGESFQSTAPSIDWLDYYLGPTGIPGRLRSANELLNPIEGLRDAGTSAASGDYLGAATDTAAVLIPVGGALAARGLGSLVSRGSDDAADALTDALTGMTRRDFLRTSAAAGGIAALGPDATRVLAPDTARVAARSVAQVAPTVGPVVSNLSHLGAVRRVLSDEVLELERARREFVDSFGGPSRSELVDLFGRRLSSGDPRLEAIDEQLDDVTRRLYATYERSPTFTEDADRLVSRLREDPSWFADELDALYEAQVAGDIPLFVDEGELPDLGHVIFDELAGGQHFHYQDPYYMDARQIEDLKMFLDEPWQIEALQNYRDYVDKVFDLRAARSEK